MRYPILLFLGFLTLHAQEPTPLQIQALCSNTAKEHFQLTLHSDKLNLSDEAIIDNLGGYVDLPEERFYLKTADAVYPVKGSVEQGEAAPLNTFTAELQKDAEAFISMKTLKQLTNSTPLQFIQKINLDGVDKANNPKTNTLAITINAAHIKQAYEQCAQQMQQSDGFPLKTPLLAMLAAALGVVIFIGLRRFQKGVK